MNLTPLDWSQAQGLLLKLVQLLSPFVVRPSEASSFLAKRFFRGPIIHLEEESLSQRKIKILNQLCAVQEEVEKWTGEGGGKKTELLQIKEEKVPSAFKNLEKDEETPAPISDSKKRPRQDSSVPVLKPKDSLPKMAKELVHQVQTAIAQMTNSKHFADPNAALVIQTLKAIQPRLHRIIETVLEEKEKPTKLRTPDASRPAIASPRRREFFKRLKETTKVESKTALDSQKNSLEPEKNSQEKKTLERLKRGEKESSTAKEILQAPSKEKPPAPFKKEPFATAIPLSLQIPSEKSLRKKKKKKERPFSEEETPDHTSP